MKIPEKYIETEDFEKGFAQYYEREILPLGTKTESNRLALTDRLPFLQIAAITVIFILTACFIYNFHDIHAFFSSRHSHRSPELTIFVGILIFAWWLIVKRPKAKYVEITKDLLLPRLLRYFDANLFYEPDEKFDKKQIKEHNIFSKSFDFLTNDFFVGKYKGISIKIAEKMVAIGTYDPDRYNGILIHLTDVRHIEGRILIKPSDYLFDSKDKAKTVKKENLKPLELPEISLPENSILYSDSEETAKRILTKDLQKKLIQLNSMFDSSGIRFSTKKHEIMVFIPSRQNLFEPGGNDIPATNVKEIKRLIKEIRTVLDIVEFLAGME